jgi:mono/diheme cytochrome c family protein
MLARWALTLCLAAASSVFAQSPSLERGSELLRRNQCMVCHPILGAGGDSAPDLGIKRPGRWDPAAFAANLWNHAPGMWNRMVELNIEPPELPAADMRELYEYLSSLWRYDTIGVASLGRQVWKDEHCFRCHAITGDSNGIGPPVAAWPALPDAIAWVAQMWNHAGPMAEQLDVEGGVWPVFKPQEFADLMAYVRNLELLRPLEPAPSRQDIALGRKLFVEGECSGCHTIGGGEEGRIDLAPALRGKTLSQLAVGMWNHGPVMSTSASADKVELPQLDRQEMADLLAYLSIESDRNLGGDPRRGERAFDQKSCSACHSRAGEAPPLRVGQSKQSAVTFAVSIWRHGPDMLDEMRLQGVDWPTLTADDVADLVAYLNQ